MTFESSDFAKYRIKIPRILQIQPMIETKYHQCKYLKILLNFQCPFLKTLIKRINLSIKPNKLANATIVETNPSIIKNTKDTVLNDFES